MRNIIILLSVLAIAAPHDGFGQKKMGRYHKNLLYEADLYFMQGDYYYASELYGELHKVDTTNADVVAKLGICFYELPTFKDKAIPYLELGVKLGAPEAHFYLAKARIEGYRFYDALELISAYEEKSERQHSVTEIGHLKASAQRASEMVRAPVSVTVKNLGAHVNSEVHDYAPIWDPSGDRIYFTSRRKRDDRSVKDFTEQFDENIYEVDLTAQLAGAVVAAEPLNSRTNDAAVACSPDGMELIVYRTSKDGYSGDLYISEKTPNGWGELIKLSDKINSKYQEASASFGGPEANVLYFSSDRPEGYGGKDIYKVQRLPDGSWSQPQNLGETINTPYDEDAPFLAADGSLYFASKGHENMGGYDIFCALPTKEGWANPASLGYPINTPGDDIFFTIDSSGKMAYFSSERAGGYGLQDIYQVIFDESNTIIFKGQITTLVDEIPKNASVTLLDKEMGGVEGFFQPDPKRGNFVLALNTNKKYTVLVEAEGYETLERSLFFGTENSDSPKEVSEEFMLSK